MLAVLKHGITDNTILPILENIKVFVKDGLLYMQSTDNNLTVVMSEAIEGIVEDMAFLLTSSALPLLNQLKSGEVEFFADKLSNTVKITHGKNLYKFPMEDVADYPIGGADNYESICELDFLVLKQALENAMVFTHDSSANSMSGVFLEISRGQITVVSTNAQILLKTVINCQGPEETQKLIIPTKVISAMKTMKYTGKVYISANEKNIAFILGNIVFTQRLMDENYPNYERVIPTQTQISVLVKKNIFKEALKRLGILSNKVTHSLAMVFNNEKMCIVAADIDKGTDGKEFLDVSSETEEQRVIGFSESFMSLAVQCLTNDDISIELSNGERGAMLIREEDEDSIKTILVMPIMLDDSSEFKNLLQWK